MPTAPSTPLAATNASLPALADLAPAVARLLSIDGPRYRRLWAYYRNPLTVVATGADASSSTRPYRQAQEWGLPSRITGVRAGFDASPLLANAAAGVARKEVVIENDIAWRVDMQVDFLFGKPIVINSAAASPARGQIIAELLRLILARHGGMLMLQQLALLGSVYGFVDVLVKLDACGCDALRGTAAAMNSDTSASDQSAAAPATCAGTGDLGRPPASVGHGGSGGPANADESHPDAGARPSHVPPHITGFASRGDSLGEPGPEAGQLPSHDALPRIARLIRIELVEPARALPALGGPDGATVDGYAQVYYARRSTITPSAAASSAHPSAAGMTRRSGLFARLRQSTTNLFSNVGPAQPLAAACLDGGNFGGGATNTAFAASTGDAAALVVEVIGPNAWARYEDGVMVASGGNSLGQIPLVHVQNLAVPFQYAGMSDVEPLLPLQDELNTRLSDRAHRVSLQSFKMYLGKGIDNFLDLPVGPGRMWATDNTDAEVEEFGGDASAPSEAAHIDDVREALDKASGVSPIAAGAVKDRIGRLTSAAALRVTMQNLLAKTERKRTTYGTAIERICELALTWLDVAGVFATTPDERKVDISWPSPLPEDEMDSLQEAQLKLQIGVPRETVLSELGY